MRQWQLHHGLPSFNLDGRFPDQSAPQPSGQRGGSSASAKSSGHTKRGGGEHLSVFNPDDRGRSVATKTISPPKLTKVGRRGQVDPFARIGDDRAGKPTVSVLIPAAEMYRCDDIELANLSNANDCKPGDIVLFRTGVDDPCEIIADALARGASAILTEQLLPCPLPQAIVGDVEMAAATIRRHQLGKPDERQLTIAVTGQGGKTTTALWIAKLTREMGLATAYETSLGVCDSANQSVPANWVDGGVELIERLNQSAENSAAVSIIEINDAAATSGRYDSIQFDIVVCVGSKSAATDFGPSPLAAILDCLVDDGVVVTPVRNQEAIATIEQHGTEMVTYGPQDADVTYDVLENRNGLMTLLLSAGDTMHVVETTMTGTHNAANLAAAACIGRLFDRPIHTIGESLGSLRSVPGRAERIAVADHASVMIDAAATPTTIARVLADAQQSTTGNVWAILAIEDGDAALPMIGSKLERFSDHNILTAAGNKSSFLATAHEVIDGVEKCIHCRLICDPAEAVRHALTNAKSNDTIVILTGRRGTSPASSRTNAQNWKRLVNKASDAITAGDESSIELKLVRPEDQ